MCTQAQLASQKYGQPIENKRSGGGKPSVWNTYLGLMATHSLLSTLHPQALLGPAVQKRFASGFVLQ